MISDEIDREEPIIPPMLIQPLIENCFIHAFSDEVKNPEITLKITKNKYRLELSISDNGRGLAPEMKDHKSKALKLLEERIQLLNKDNCLIVHELPKGIEVKIILL